MDYKSKFKGAEIDARLEKMVNVTYEELVALRNEGKLIAGQMYRMTDYETTCGWENTQCAGHPFDLVLTALDNKTLDEKCSAIWSERDADGYFANSNLPTWDVRYCLDNDTKRFDWAIAAGQVVQFSLFGANTTAVINSKLEMDGNTYYSANLLFHGTLIVILSTSPTPQAGDILYISDGATILTQTSVIASYTQSSGKGVIYKLVDEANNNICYDFKNIMFLRPISDGEYNDDGELLYVYSLTKFDDYNNILDASLHNFATDNDFLSSKDIVLMTYVDGIFNNRFYRCSKITIGVSCRNSSFANNSDSLIKGGCVDSFWGDSTSFHIKGNCFSTKVGMNCNISVQGDFNYNTISNMVYLTLPCSFRYNEVLCAINLKGSVQDEIGEYDSICHYTIFGAVENASVREINMLLNLNDTRYIEVNDTGYREFTLNDLLS